MKEKLITILLNLGLGIVYMIVGKFGLTLAFANASATAIWPPTGIALAALLIFGRRVVPAIFIGAFFVNLTTAGNIGTSLGIAFGNTLEGIVGAYLVKRFAHGVFAFENFTNIFKFAFLAGLVATTVSANIGTLTLVLGKLATWNDFFSIWLTWWLGDIGGNMIIAPAILIWWTHHRIRFHLLSAVHFFLCLLSIFIVTEIIFSGIVPYPYLFIPLGIWAAFWFGRRGATVITLLVAGILIYYTLSGRGPFIYGSLNDSMIQLQIFLSTFSLTSLVFASAILTIKKSQKTIETHEQHFKSMIEHSFDAIFIIDPTAKILYASPSLKRLLGYTPEELTGTIAFDLVDKQDTAMTMTTLAQIVLKPNGAATVEARLIKKDKTIIWVEATGTNLLLVPAINGVVVNFHDITDRKLAQQKLTQDKMETQAMLTSIGEGIIATDRSGKITMVNKTACELLGWKPKELVGKMLVEQIPLVDDAGNTITEENRPLKKVIRQGKQTLSSRATSYIKKDGTKLAVHFTVTPILLDGILAGTIEVFHDISQEKAIDKAKSEFVSVASHQLRTPLATISWYLEELLRSKENLTEKQTKYAAVVYAASKRMISLINSLLNASRLELGTLIVKPENVSVVALAKEVLQDLHFQIEEKHIAISENYQANIPPFSADPKLFSIILQNLLANAVKYSKNEGKIEIKIFYNAQELLISVTDNGYGIPKHQQEKIFTKLFRADNARSIEPDGSGLGLFIIKEIVDDTGGKVWFTSEENKGTIFSVSFPATGMKKKEGQKSLI